MENIIFNSLIKSSKKPSLWLNIRSAAKTTNDDYIIEYSLVFEKENGEKIKANNFAYKAYLSDFATKEKEYIKQLIKLRCAVKESASTVVAEATVI